MAMTPLASYLPASGPRGELSGPDEVTEVGRRHPRDLGDRRLRDLLLQQYPDLSLLAIELG